MKDKSMTNEEAFWWELDKILRRIESLEGDERQRALEKLFEFSRRLYLIIVEGYLPDEVFGVDWSDIKKRSYQKEAE